MITIKDDFNTNFPENIIFVFFSAILKNAIRSDTDDDFVDIEMQSDMLMILSCLCDGDMHRKVSRSRSLYSLTCL